MKTLFLGTMVLAWCAMAGALHAAAPEDKTAASSDDTADSAAAKMKAELHHASEAVAAAKKPEDLDAELESLQKYQGGTFDPGAYTRQDQVLFQQLAGALEFVKSWQNYLADAAAGRGDQARNDLSNLLQNNSGLGIVPRSKILALAAGAPGPAVAAPITPVAPEIDDVQKIIDGIQTLDDMEPALKQAYALGPTDPAAQNFAKDLASMVEVYGDLKAGLPTSVNVSFMGDVTGPGVSVKVNCLLLNFILQHYFDTYSGAPPAAEESPAAYTARVKADAMAAKDWALLKKALTAHAYLIRNVAGTGGSNEPDDETAGLNKMIDGINQEAAQQYALAVGSYQDALKSGSLDIPAKYIGERLEGIRRDHPAEYDSGMASFLSPPMPAYYPGMNPPIFNPALPRRMPYWPGGSAPAALPRPSPLLAIPGTHPAAAPAPNAPAATP